MATALISIGSNLGDGHEIVRRALAFLEGNPDTHVVRSSRLFRTRPVGGPEQQQDFINAAAVLETSLSPQQLLAALEDVESRFGRVRGERWGPRSVDLDLLLFDDAVSDEDTLTIPHPRMSFRRFVLEPAAEIASEMVHPVCKSSIGELVDHLNTAPHYIAVAGPTASGKAALAKWLQEHFGCPALLEPQLPDRSLWTDGPSLEKELELAEKRARLLAVPAWCDTPGLRARLTGQAEFERRAGMVPPMVSDFWFGQSRVLASLNRPDDEAFLADRKPYYALLGCLSHHHYLVMYPKLVIWLDASAEATLNRLAADQDAGERERIRGKLQRFRRHLSDVIGVFVRGPLLRLTTDDLDLVKIEAAAALNAIKPLQDAHS